ncbi:MAG: prepilin-type N-terminal cleavage/methylation domain-containing protein [bacterium]
MKHDYPNLPGFTLLEMLVAVSVFVLVASVATVTLATTVRLQANESQSQQLAAQSQQVMQAITSDLQSSINYYSDSTGSTPLDWPFAPSINKTMAAAIQVVQFNQSDYSQMAFCAHGNYLCYEPDNILVMTMPVFDSAGAGTGKFIKRIYCPEPTPGASAIAGKRLARFTSEPLTTLPSFDPDGSQLSRPRSCTASDLQAMFKGGSVMLTTVDYVTAPTMEVLSLRFIPVFTNLTSINPSRTAGVDPAAVTIQLTARYNVANGKPALSGRAGDNSLISTPMTFRFIANRHSDYSSGPQATPFPTPAP